MDRKTVMLDSLVLPRAVRVLERGVLVGAPPNLWLARDTTGDLRADVKELVRGDYGTLQSNPEHNANGLLWGIDNWIHNANYAGQFRARREGGFTYRWTPSLGQWGVSSDDYGRLYRNSNEDPLRADLIPSHYAARDSAARFHGIYERLTPNVPVWPAHKTPAVNRGYRSETLRPDSTLAHYTSAGTPTVYVGDRLPAELRGNVFVTEPAGNLVGRFIVHEDTTGTVTARSAYERSEFLTSTDERFRPVNVATAPDGTLYVVDMYRGIIQHRAYITGYLEQKIRERGMEQPIGLGRIYRIVHSSTRRGERPRLSHATPAELVGYLAHPNGWWRITAQRLLVERGERSVAPALRELVRSSADDRTRLHALWTLDGLGESDLPTITTALSDTSPHVRAAAIRIWEPWLARSDPAVKETVLRLVADRTPEVRRQLAASLGELPPASRESALAAVVARHGDDPVVADMVASAVGGREVRLLGALISSGILDAQRPVDETPVVRALAAAVVRRRDVAGVQQLLSWAVAPARPRWQRLALLDAMGGQRRRPPAPPTDHAIDPASDQVPDQPTGARAIELPRRPDALLALSAGRDSALAGQARRAADALDWPGKSRPRPTARPLTPAERQRFAAGRTQFLASCAGCHQANGAGQAGLARSLVQSPWVLGVPVRLIRIVQHGKEGQMLMPPVGGTLTSEQLAAVLTYIRRSWGNDADPIEPALVDEVRGATSGRSRPWTEAELLRIRR
jgi:putative membrane-bound dehydrogenase-like protein